MRGLCIALAIFVFVSCTGLGFYLGHRVSALTTVLVSYNPVTITAIGTAVGAIIGAIGASGFLISFVLAGRLDDAETAIRKLRRRREDNR